MHFFMWLFFAAPASFFALESASQLLFASLSHFFMKLFIAAPASLFSLACILHVAPCAYAAIEHSQNAAAKISIFIFPSELSLAAVLRQFDPDLCSRCSSRPSLHIAGIAQFIR